MWNAATVARACRAGLAGLALVVLPASLAEAQYGPRTTIGNNYQQTSTAESQNGIDLADCNLASCFFLFQRTPQQRRLIIQHVACRVSVSAGGLLYGVLQTRKGPADRFRRTPLVPVHIGGTYWAVNSPVMHLIKSGERPYLLFQNSESAVWFAECSVSGKLRKS